MRTARRRRARVAKRQREQAESCPLWTTPAMAHRRRRPKTRWVLSATALPVVRNGQRENVFRVLRKPEYGATVWFREGASRGITEAEDGVNY
jgi:hypothetical protein